MSNSANAIDDDSAIGSEQSSRANETRLPQRAALNVTIAQRQSPAIIAVNAGDLTEDDIVARQSRKNKSGPPFRLAQVRKGEGHDDDIAFYNFAQAASSSGVSQSLARTSSEASIFSNVSYRSATR